MHLPSPRTLPSLLLLLGTLATAPTGCGRTTDPACPDHVPCAAVEPALASDPTLPLDAAHTSVVLVVACTLRKDRVEPWGTGRPTAPFLSALARHGVLFERTIVQAPWTRPSIGSLLTSRQPAVLRLDDPDLRAFSNRVLPEDETLLSEALAGRGYHTIGVSANPNVSTIFGFHQGFAVFREPESLWRREGSITLPPATDLVEQVLADVAQAPQDRPVFVQLVTVDTHAPRSPDSAAAAALRDSPLPDGLSREDRRRLAEYDASVRTLDGALAHLFLELRKHRPNLLFVLVGDHGEGLSLPEHHGMAHGNFLYTSSIDVPFLAWHPALPSPGRRIGGLATGLDVLPTVLDLLGVERPPRVSRPGEADAVRGLRENALSTEAFSQTWFREANKASVVAMVDDTPWHLLLDNRMAGGPLRNRTELYRLDGAAETEDLAGGKGELAARLKSRVEDWQDAVRREAEAAGPPVVAHPQRETEEQLKAMGYLD